jgi:tetratricopeptide (TPR) repeat protein
LGKYKKAIDLLNTIKQESKFLESSFLLGTCYAQLHDYDHAHNYFAELVRNFLILPIVSTTLAVLKCFHANFNKHECISLFKKSLEINPRYTDARLNLMNLQKEDYQSLKITTKPLRETLIHS